MNEKAMIPANKRNLPALPIREAERMGAIILSTLDRMGFTHENGDGSTFGVCFERADLWGNRWVSFTVDVARLWHVDVLSLASPKTKAQLEAATKHDMRVMVKPGLTYAVRLGDKPQAARLPSLAKLDLGQRPGDDALSVPIGVGHSGPVWVTLPKLGHALICGATGAGKSNWVHCALAALLTACGPDVLRVVLLDPKRNELTPWAMAPHVMGSIAHSETEAAQALGDVVDELDRRGDLLGQAGARDLAGYNRKADNPLPWVLVVIDETLDLVLQAGGNFSNFLQVIATRGRSAGVILWAATQHASAVSGLPRVVNVNLGARLVFRVNDAAAAHVAGCPGAHSIPRDKPGRMLARLDGGPVELQGYYLADDALAAIAGGLGSKPAGPALSDGERALVRFAVDNLGGAFIIGKLEGAFSGAGWTNHKLRTLAKTWERRGLLTKPQHATDPRRVTQELCDLCGDLGG